ncbi:dipeptide ABC transporter ATP-binding protein [Variovorax sp. PCZ-1]|uniref:ABC transporter ATP-binding protein n=1 Tax=Variovorax sp. PCZ-1 TaxID=2835533 RepID=UPI001BD18D45|nr:dipeptide ABC transporter ATP-binding protein [Variovorax sp. PCZ-1]MBS7806959.1 ABC transporter ATP-binding protein [Variovorax sp. PCZ-1]
MSALLEVKDLKVSFGGKEVVKGIHFSINAGEKLALVGGSGSGKSVTALSLLRLALNAKISGQALFDGRDTLAISEQELEGLRGDDIAMIFQEPMTALNPLMTIGRQIAEIIELKKGASKQEAHNRAIELLIEVGIPEPERRAAQFPHQLSGGQRQRAMIAMALSCNPKLLLADEPTTALDVTLRLQILNLIGELQKTRNMAVLLITHDLNLVRKFADRIAVMEKGHVVEQGSVSEVLAHPQHAYTQRLLASKPVRDVLPAQAEAAPMIKAEKLRITYPKPLGGFKGWFKKGEFIAVHEASLNLGRGQTLGIIGESGSGKSTMALALLGLLPATSTHGQIFYKRKEHIAGYDSAQSATENIASMKFDTPLRQSLQVVFQDPYSSLSPRMTIEEIVGEGLRIHEPSLSAAQRQVRVLAALQEVGLDETQFPGLLQRYPHEFSGGQRQRIAIARALIVNPQTIILDEPTSALDVTIQQQVLTLLQKLQRERGLSYLIITHDVDVIRAMAHEVLVMKDGLVVEQGSVDTMLLKPQQEYTKLLVAASV